MAGAGEFFEGLLGGLLPEVKEAVKTRVTQASEERKRQKTFSDTVNLLVKKGAIETAQRQEEKGGFANPEDVPKNLGGQPLKSLKQDKVTGKWFGEYGPPTSLFGALGEGFGTPGTGGGAGGAGVGAGFNLPNQVGGIRGFRTEADAIAAFGRGEFKRGAKITIGGVEKDVK